MNDIWVVFPTGNSKAGQVCADAWRAHGFKVGVLTDLEEPTVNADLVLTPNKYPGCVASLNLLAKSAFNLGACGVVLSADDGFPGSTAERFWQRYQKQLGGFGVLQPIGDFYEAFNWCAPCPIIGRSTFESLYGGNGPLCGDYRHYFADQEIRDVAILNGCFATDPELTIEHRHSSRGFTDTLPAEKRAFAQSVHAGDSVTYEQRKASGFPGAWTQRRLAA
jgi:hypothetical protein